MTDNLEALRFPIGNLDIELQTADVISLEEFKTYLNKENVQILDVSGATEFETEHIEGAENLFVGTI